MLYFVAVGPSKWVARAPRELVADHQRLWWLVCIPLIVCMCLFSITFVMSERRRFLMRKWECNLEVRGCATLLC